MSGPSFPVRLLSTGRSGDLLDHGTHDSMRLVEEEIETLRSLGGFDPWREVTLLDAQGAEWLWTGEGTVARL